MSPASEHELELERELDTLYGLPLSEFTGARDRLAKRARDEGERAIAARIKELRKPSVSAWVVNQLVRDNEIDLKRLLNAGKKLAEAQLGAVSGRNPQGFLEARREENEALALLARAARQVLERGGHGTSALERIVQTLRTAATSEEGRELLKLGRLTEDLQPTGFEAFAGVSPIAGPARQGSRRRKTPDRSGVAEARGRLREAKKRERALSREADAAEREAAQAERRAAELREAADVARKAAAKAADEVAAAEGALL